MFIPLDLKTHFSIMRAISKPKELAKLCVESGYKSAAITDYNSISGAIQFYTEMKKVGIKPILGATVDVIDNEQKLTGKPLFGRLILLCMNKNGWQNLIKLISRSNDSDRFDEKPNLELTDLKDKVNDIIVIDGFPGSLLTNSLVDSRLTYLSRNVEFCKINELSGYDIAQYWGYLVYEIGVSEFFLGVGKENSNFPLQSILNEYYRSLGHRKVILTNSHYNKPEDAVLQRILLCSSMKITMQQSQDYFVNHDCDPSLKRFFYSDEYCFPNHGSLSEFTKEELEDTELVDLLCEDYEILSPPKLPNFECPNGLTESEYIKELCRKGWKEKLVNKGVVDTEEKKEIYKERVLKELDVLDLANLNGYFLIVYDIINWAKNQNWLVSAGRGSVGGSLVAYLLGITQLDSIAHNLIFERFMNVGRLEKDKISLCDVDTDFPREHREKVIEYIKDKYGKEKVTQMVTFSELKGSSALREVLRVNSVCSSQEMDTISKLVPHQDKITDKMNEVDEHSVLLYTLKYMPDLLKDYARLNDREEVEGDFAEWFNKAIEIEGTIKDTSKHASAVVIFNEDIINVSPLIRDKSSDNKIAGMEMKDAESVGLVKMDILGVNTLDRLMLVNQLEEN